MGQYCC